MFTYSTGHINDIEPSEWQWNYRKYKTQQIPKLKCFSSRFAAVFVQYIEARCWVENKDEVGAAPTGDAPTTSEWSTIVLPTKVPLILEVWRYHFAITLATGVWTVAVFSIFWFKITVLFSWYFMCLFLKKDAMDTQSPHTVELVTLYTNTEMSSLWRNFRQCLH